MNRLKPVLLGVVLGVALCLLAHQGCRMIDPDPREALPVFTYQEVHIVNSGNPTGDGSYRLKAKVSEDGFNRFVKKMGFDEETYDLRTGKYVKPSDDPTWQCWAQYTNGMLEYYNAAH